jgi:hypothetical protein
MLKMDDFKYTDLRSSSDEELSMNTSQADESLLEKPVELHRSPRIYSRIWFPLIFHGSLILLYTMAFLAVFENMKVDRLHGPGVIHSMFPIHNELDFSNTISAPVRPAIHYEPLKYVVEAEVNSPYVGEPRPELDLAWHELLQCTRKVPNASSRC